MYEAGSGYAYVVPLLVLPLKVGAEQADAYPVPGGERLPHQGAMALGIAHGGHGLLQVGTAILELEALGADGC